VIFNTTTLTSSLTFVSSDQKHLLRQSGRSLRGA
jgi:hypothetical protein